MRIAVLLTRSLKGTGFATRISSMLESYVLADHELDVFHFRRQNEEGLRDSIASAVRRYQTLPLIDGRYRQHIGRMPPLAWQCLNANKELVRGDACYDVVQAETCNTWSIARSFPSRKRLAVLHDDDAARLRGLAGIEPIGRRRLADLLLARKYARWQRIVLGEADRVWFASQVERERLMPPTRGSMTMVVPNAASDSLWSVPAIDYSSPMRLLFVAPGAYVANASGLKWFMEGAWPRVRSRISGVHVRVVGPGWETHPPYPATTFAGYRQSLDREYANARVVIAPLFAGGGTNLKVVEGMAASRPVVTTPWGVEGLPHSDGVRACTDGASFAAEIVHFLTEPASAHAAGLANRAAVAELRWSAVWERALIDLEGLARAV
jgi:glycosyltransferase involved in cell wall biosynthesis